MKKETMYGFLIGGVGLILVGASGDAPFITAMGFIIAISFGVVSLFVSKSKEDD